MARPSDWSPVDMDSDPTPGDPERIRELADELQTFADDVGEALGRIRGMASDRAVLDWAGVSAETFRAEFDGVPDNLTKLQTSYDLCAQALSAYWPVLQNAQGMADRALAQAVAAQGDLTAAQGGLTAAEDWVGRAAAEADRLAEDGGRQDVPPPSEEDVRAATRDHAAAQQAAQAARERVADAESRLAAARALAAEARELREEAARGCASAVDAASDAGIRNRSWWERLVEWFSDAWDTLVAICKIVVAVLGVIALIIGGPVAWVVLAAAVVVLADTLVKFARGQAGLLDVAFAALGCIPGMRGLTTFGGLARGVRGLAQTGLRGLRQGVLGLGRQARGTAVQWGKRVFSRDPVDFATGEVGLPATDVELPGVLPLVIERYHLSGHRDGRWFGRSWASTFDQRLVLDDHGAALFTADGMRLLYPVPVPGGDVAVLPVEGPRWGLAWDGHPGSPMTVHQPETGRTLHFAPVPGRPGGELPLTAVSDRNGNRVTLAYDDRGAPSEVAHTGGYRVGIATDGDRVTGLTLLSDPGRPVLRRYGYDAAGNLAEVYDSSGLPVRFAYDGSHRLVRWEDRGGHWYRYDYDAAGRCVLGTGTDRVLEYRYTYDPARGITRCEDSLGHSTVYAFNDCFQLVAETDPLGHTTRRTWDRYDRPLTVTDPLGRTTRHTHDDDGNVTVLTRPDGSRLVTEYNELGLPTTVVEPDGATWHQTYDAHGNPAVLVDPAGHRTRFTHHPGGGLATVTDPLGHTTRVRCDAAGLPVAVTDAQGETQRYRYDAFGRPVEITDPLGAVTRQTFSPEGRPLSVTDPLGGTETWEWDADGNLLAHTDAGGGTTRFTYGPFHQPVTQTDPDGARHTLVHDTELNLVRVTGPDGRHWEYSYDAAGRLVAQTDFGGRTTTYTLDATGLPLSRTNPAGQVVTYTWNELGLLVAKTTDDGTVLRYAYDRADRVVEATAPGVEVTRRYDVLGNLVAETVNGRTLTVTHDPLGRTAIRTTPGGHRSAWTYTPDGAPRTLTTGGRTLTFDRDAAGRETGRTVQDTLVLTHTLDLAGRVTAQRLTAGPGRELHRREYGYRPDGYPVLVTEPAGATAYDLDAVGRVTAVTGPGRHERYAYDAAGNRTGGPGADDAPATAGEYAYTGDLLTRAGGIRYRYDAAGRAVERQRTRLSRTRETWTYTWDAENRLTHVTAPGGHRWRYLYDAFGRRVAKHRLGDDGVTVVERTEFTWHETTLVEETAWPAGGGPRTTLTWDHDGVAPLAQTERVTDATGQEEIDRRFHAIVTDLVGTPTRLVDETGTTVWRARFTVWGAPVPAPAGAAGDTARTPLRFPGQYADDETGWYHNHFRHYDPATGRYTTPDPLGLVPAPNPYTYPHNPLFWIDPFGLAYTLNLRYKNTWTAAQRAEADAKIAILNANVMIVTRVRRTRSAARVWRRAGNRTRTGRDVDHQVDLQLGGSDVVANMWLLDRSVNRSLGAQISNRIRAMGLRPGDRVTRITIR